MRAEHGVGGRCAAGLWLLLLLLGSHATWAQPRETAPATQKRSRGESEKPMPPSIEMLEFLGEWSGDEVVLDPAFAASPQPLRAPRHAQPEVKGD